ncbi:MAG TPA: hypothetical protein VLA96_02850 [Terriglobales bacterium]|nr:hypothetical protein [Terriglobales bacterium]
MDISFQVTLEEFAEAGRAFSAQRWLGRWANSLFYLVGTLTIIGTLYYAWEYGGEAYPLGLILGVTLLAIPSAMRASVAANFKKRSAFQKPVTMVIGDEALELTTCKARQRSRGVPFRECLKQGTFVSCSSMPSLTS